MVLTTKDSAVSILVILAVLPIVIHSAKALTPQTNNTISLDTFSSYHDPIFGYSLRYPLNWLHIYILGKASVFFPNGTANLIVTSIEHPPAISLDELSKETLNILQKFQNFQFISDETSTLAGLPAHRFEYTWTNSVGTTIVQILVVTVKNNREYGLSFSATPNEIDNYAPIVQEIFNSFQLR